MQQQKTWFELFLLQQNFAFLILILQFNCKLFFMFLIQFHVRKCAYQGERNVSFSENLACFVFINTHFEIHLFVLLPTNNVQAPNISAFATWSSMESIFRFEPALISKKPAIERNVDRLDIDFRLLQCFLDFSFSCTCVTSVSMLISIEQKPQKA